jgi:hypothetical protein
MVRRESGPAFTLGRCGLAVTWKSARQEELMRTLSEELEARGGRALHIEDRATENVWIEAAVSCLRDLRHSPIPPRLGQAPRAIEVVLFDRMDMSAYATLCREEDGRLVDFVGVPWWIVERLGNELAYYLHMPGVLEELKQRSDILPPPVDGFPREEILGGAALLKLAFDHVLGHEFAHLLNGHVDYLAKHRSTATAGDNEVFRGAVVDWDRYALEYDADCTAVVFSVERGIRRVQTERDLPLQADTAFGVRRVHASERVFAYHLGFVFFVAFNVMLSRMTCMWGGRTHPASQIRSQWSLNMVFTLEAAGRVPAGFAAACHEGWWAALFASYKARGEPVPVDDVIETNRIAGGPLAVRIYERWARLRPELEELKRGGGKLAPAARWGENWLQVITTGRCERCETLIDACAHVPPHADLMEAFVDPAGAIVYDCSRCGTRWQVLTLR